MLADASGVVCHSMQRLTTRRRRTRMY